MRAQLTAPAVPRGNQVPRNEVNEITDRGVGDGGENCVCAEFSRISFGQMVSILYIASHIRIHRYTIIVYYIVMAADTV